MFNALSSCHVDCPLVFSSRAVGALLLGVAVIGLEAWLRVPVRPLLDGWLQDAQARATAFFRNLSF
jgi:hypothetical protein